MIKKWLDVFIDEKEIDRDLVFKVESESGVNYIPFDVVVEHINITTDEEKKAIKRNLVKIDFLNLDVVDYFKHLATVIAK